MLSSILITEPHEEEINFDERRKRITEMFIPLENYKYNNFFVVKNISVRELFYLIFSDTRSFMDNFYTVQMKVKNLNMG